MNNDERIEKLTDRVDALTQSVELLSSMHQDHEKAMAAFTNRVTTVLERLTDIVTDHER